MRFAAGFIAAWVAAAPAMAAPPPHCAPLSLWGDGRHDDTLALNAWLRGDPVRWGDSSRPVGSEIDGGEFLLSAPIYVTSGTGRTLAHFRMLWPKTGERLQGGTIAAGTDPNEAPVVSGIAKTGGDAGEGKPYQGPDEEPPPAPAGCLIS